MGARVLLAAAAFIGFASAIASCGGETATAPITRPNLRVRSITFAPASPDSADSITVSILVENAGAAGAPATSAGIILDGRSVCPGIPSGALEPGGAETVACSLGRCSPGRHSVEACADAQNDAEETDEDDNCLSGEVNVLPGPATGSPDLEVRILGFIPPDPGPDDSVAVSLKVTNRGTAMAPASVTQVGVDGIEHCRLATPALDAQAYTSLSCALGRVVSGNHEVLARADADSTIAESDEGNNQDLATLHVATPVTGPDLWVMRISFRPEVPAPSDSVTILAEISNSGSETAPESRTRISIDSLSPCGAVVTAAIPPGEVVEVSCRVGPQTAGGHPVEVEADAGNAVSETDELNNVENGTLVVSGERP